MSNIYDSKGKNVKTLLCQLPIFSTHNTAIVGNTVTFKHFDALIKLTEFFPVCIELDIQIGKPGTQKILIKNFLRNLRKKKLKSEKSEKSEAMTDAGKSLEYSIPRNICSIGHDGHMGIMKAKVKPESLEIDGSDYSQDINIVNRLINLINLYKAEKNRYPLIITFDISKELKGVTIKETEKCLETVNYLYQLIGQKMGKKEPNNNDYCYNEKSLNLCMDTIIVRLKPKHKDFIKSANINLIYPYIDVKTSKFTLKKKTPQVSTMTQRLSLGRIEIEEEVEDTNVEYECSITRIYPSSHTLETQKEYSQKMANIIIQLFRTEFERELFRDDESKEQSTRLREILRTFKETNMIAFNYEDISDSLNDLEQSFMIYYSKLNDSNIPRSATGYGGGSKTKKKKRKYKKKTKRKRRSK